MQVLLSPYGGLMNVEEYTRAKWTPDQKRQDAAETIDIYADQRITAVRDRDPAELRRVQSTLAVIALEEAEEPVVWLRDALDALDLRRVIPVKRETEVCGSYRGTLRGYNMHLRRYTRVCVACEVVRQEALAAKTARKGVPEGADVKWS